MDRLLALASVRENAQKAGEARDAATETIFLNVYGSPMLQALAGLRGEQPLAHRIERDLLREAKAAQMHAALELRFEHGGLEEAVLRSLVYIRLPDGKVDERGFAALKLIRAARPPEKRMDLAHFKEILRDQFLLLLMDEERAIAALPKLLGADSSERKAGLDALHRVLAARGALSAEAKRRLARVEVLFEVRPEKSRKGELTNA